MDKNTKPTNTRELREVLLEAIMEVKNNKMDFKQASAIAKLSTATLQSVKMDLEVLKFNANTNGIDRAGEKVLQLVNK